MTKRTILMPEYLTRFACIGPECEDSCCHGFSVDIDKKTYERYIETSNQELKARFDETLKMHQQPIDDSQYAYIEYPENRRCPMLSNEGWCKIQLELGEAALSETCHSYPRVTYEIHGELEKSATPSCPEIARLLLLDEAGVRFVEVEEDEHTRQVIAYRMKPDNPLKKRFWDLRIFSINVLQNRALTPSVRMLFLGLFYQKISAEINEQRYSEIPKIIEQFRSQNESPQTFADLFAKIPTNPIFQTNVFLKTMIASGKLGLQFSRFAEKRNVALDGFGLTDFASHNDMNTVPDVDLQTAETCQAILSRWADKMEFAYGYVFENYLVNSVFVNVFPIGSYKTLIEEYMMLAAKFILVRLLAVGVAEHMQERFNEHELVACIQAFSKTIEHNRDFVAYIHEQMMNNQCNTLAKMTLLLKMG